ncbi:MAG: fumarylacetoacetate hydrolase family protein [Gammaproteobacteria bacterium]|nr:fumarylacetoacetate hydrolase family protein [Gammaproteobacteria bacterium]
MKIPPLPAYPTVAIAGSDERFPLHRIYCVGWNYAEHVREMGLAPEREPPIFFQKPLDAVVPDGGDVHYPPRTQDLHYEIELVVAIGEGGESIEQSEALEHVWGYGVGIDMTRRDLQAVAKSNGQPWEASKAFDDAAPLSALRSVEHVGHPARGRIWLSVNGDLRQDGDLGQLIWSVPEIIQQLSSLFRLEPGDLIYTGTPAGVGPIVTGDVLEGGVDGIGTLRVQIV